MKKQWKVMTVLLFSGTLTLCAGAGCAGHTTKTTQSVTTQEPAPAAGAAEVQEPRPVSKTVTTTTTTQSDEGSPGIIGSTFRLLWAVISFPFRVIGALF